MCQSGWEDESSISFRCALEDETEQIDSFSFSSQDIEIVERRVVDGIQHLKINLALDALKPLGNYTLDILYTSSGFGLSASSRVIAPPGKRAIFPPLLNPLLPMPLPLNCWPK